MGKTECDDNIPIPDWFTQQIDETYEKLNLQTKQGQVHQ
jgi:hypothetical protein